MTLPPASISYAQNAEDVVLARVFAGAATGRYVDIGAGDPVEASVSKHFYDHGWRGINIEPIPSIAARLRTARPEDTTLQIAVGAKPGKATLHVVKHEWGWSTLDNDLADRYQAVHGWDVDDVEVEVLTLADVLDEHSGPIDFLKIDVEGAEHDVIAGADWSRHRPRVVVVEATQPGSPEPSHEGWEPMLVEAGYRCALFDGLNRFYAEISDTAALSALSAPASVFDAFETHQSRLARENHLATVAHARHLEDALREAKQAHDNAIDELGSLRQEVDAAKRDAAEARRESARLERRIAEVSPRITVDSRPRNEGVETHCTETPQELVARVNAEGGAYHQLTLPQGLVVKGIYDMSRYLDHFSLPADLSGWRVLDVGTASGFFALECAGRGATVTAIDVKRYDVLADLIAVGGLPIDYVIKDVYDLDPTFGEFDLVICGTLLLHLPDPVGALRAIRTVTHQRLIVSTTGTGTSVTDRDPTCRFLGHRTPDGDYWNYWEISAAALERMISAAGFTRMDSARHFDIRPEPGFDGAAAPQVVISAYP